MPKKTAAAQQPPLMPDSADATIDGIVVEVLDPEKPIVAYNPTRAAIAELTKQYGKMVFDVSTTKGLDAAKAARLAIREPRYKIEHIRKALKAPALAYSARIDAEAEEYKTALLAIETPIDEQIKAREQQQENERIERERAAAVERQRVDAAIADIRLTTACAAGKNAVEVQTLIDELADLPVDEASFGDRLPEAVLVKNATMEKLREMLAAAIEAEVEAARLQTVKAEQEAEAARLKQMQEDLARQQAELAAALAAAAPAEPDPVDDEHPFGAPEASEKQSDDSDPFAAPVQWISQEEAEELYPSDQDHSAPLGDEIPPACGGPEVDPVLGSLAAIDDQPERPTLAELVEVIADEFDVTDEQAEQWLRDAFGG